MFPKMDLNMSEIKKHKYNESQGKEFSDLNVQNHS